MNLNPPSLQESLEQSEQALVTPLLQAVFGLRLAYVGAPEGLRYLAGSPIRQHIHVGQRSGDCTPGQAGLVVQGDDATIPLLSEAFDAVFLYHALERSPDPHRLLREAERILRPSGFLILVAFNPASLSGIAHRLGRGLATAGMNLLRIHRLKDWLKLLGLKPLSVDYAFYRYPSRLGWFMRFTHWIEGLGAISRLPLGGVAVLMARKDVFGMTPLVEERSVRRLGASVFVPAQARLPDGNFKLPPKQNPST